VRRADLVQRYPAQDHGRGRDRRRQGRGQPRLVRHRSRQMPASRCLRPAEAVDPNNRTIKYKDKPLNWGGATPLCTRESKFETNEQGDCASRGFAATGFAAVDTRSGGKTLRLALP